MFEFGVADESFEAFATPSTLTKITSAGPSGDCLVDVIIDHHIEVEDDLGNIRDYSSMITMRKSDQPKWNRGDQVTQNGRIFTLQDILSDDGYLIEVAAESVS